MYTDNANDTWLLWKNLYTDILNKHAPIINIRLKGSTSPCMTNDLKNMICKRDHLKAKAVKTGSKYLYQGFRQIRSRVLSLLKHLRKDYYTKKLDETKGDMKKTWKILKIPLSQVIKAASIEKVVIRKTEITDNVGIVKPFNEHFASVGEKLAAQIENININPLDAIKKADTKFKFKSVKVYQIIKIIRKLADGKAAGIHFLPNRSLKEGVKLIAPSLCAIFSCAIYTQTCQSDLNITKVFSIFKSGKK